jgi:hypothetical protein
VITPHVCKSPGGGQVTRDGGYRYVLSRGWLTGSGRAVFIMLNPSTADNSNDDPTIRKCIGFAHHWGNAGVDVVNLYAKRATQPEHLWLAKDPVGEGNDELILDAVKYAKRYGTPLVVAWGANAKPDRVAEVEQLIASEFVVPLCLGVTKDGAPRHPLYLPYETALQPWPIRPIPDVAAAIAQPFARAHIVLAGLKAHRR